MRLFHLLIRNWQRGFCLGGLCLGWRRCAEMVALVITNPAGLAELTAKAGMGA